MAVCSKAEWFYIAFLLLSSKIAISRTVSLEQFHFLFPSLHGLYRSFVCLYRCADSRFHVLDSCTNPLTKDLANLITGGDTAENHCPQAPEVSVEEAGIGMDPNGPLDDFNVYVAERLLQISGDELDINDFFLRYQVHYSFTWIR